MNIAKFFRTLIMKNICERLLFQKVSLGTCPISFVLLLTFYCYFSGEKQPDFNLSKECNAYVKFRIQFKLKGKI